jgi:hypothetical protein
MAIAQSRLLARAAARFFETAGMQGSHGRRIKSIVRGIGFDSANPRVLLYAHYNSSYRITRLTLGLLRAIRIRAITLC